MADYTKSVNFATKDSLPTGNPSKVVKGTELNTEFDNIATAVASKADLTESLVALTSVSGADTITASSADITAYTTNQPVGWIAAGNNTTAVTLNINGLGAKSVTKYGTTALAAGDIKSGMVCIAIYDGTQFQLIDVAQDATLTALAALDSTIGAVYQTAADSFSKAPLSGKNRIINGRMLVDQRYAGAAHTITAGAALAYTVDRWWAACTGADVTGQKVSTGYQFTGAASVTGIWFGQRIERWNSYDLAGGNATFQVNLANSLLTSVTWTAYYANTIDAFGTLASPTKTQIATGTFTVTSTLTPYSATFAVPAGAATGIEIVFSVGAQTSGTWVIGNVQFEKGSMATKYEIDDIELLHVRCMRYYEIASAKTGGYNTAGEHLRSTVYYTIKRATPTVTISTTEAVNAGTITVDQATSNSLRYLQAVTATGNSYSSSSLYIDSEMKS